MSASRFLIFSGLVWIALSGLDLGLNGGDAFYKSGLHMGEVMGGLLFGLVIWSLVRLGRGEQNAPEIRQFTFNIMVIMQALLLLTKIFVVGGN